jgi:phage baseplate assembly protein V
MKDAIRLGTITGTSMRLGVIRAQVVFPTSATAEDVILCNGFASNSNPPVGTPCVVLAVNGDLYNKYAFPFNLEDAIRVHVGEKIIYTQYGSKIYLKKNGDIDITSTKNVNVTANETNITSPSMTLNGDVKINGSLIVSGNSTLTGAGTSIAGVTFLTHTHSGVTVGPGTTGPVTP